MNILIVEDTEDSRVLLEEILMANGHHIESAINGLEAHSKAKFNSPDLIISDILMPVMDGFDLCRQLKMDPELKKIPFMFYTATYTSASDEDFALSLGADRFIVKPQDPMVLMKIINDVSSEFGSGPIEQARPSITELEIEQKHINAINEKLNKKILLLEKHEKELRLSALVFDNSSEGMMVTDVENKIIKINSAFTTITGYNFDDVKGKNPTSLLCKKDYEDLYQLPWDELEKNGTWQGEIWDKRKDGEAYVKWLTINTIKDKSGKIERYVAIFYDITEKKQSDELIWRQANFDSLTKLPNRNMFQNKLQQKLFKAVKENRNLALLLIDLDLFKEINDTLGHEVGDVLLKEAAIRIRENVEKSDIVARLGGDEFSVILLNIEDISFVDGTAQKICESLAKPYFVNEEEIYLTGSLGVTLAPADGVKIDVLMKNADQAMYVAKKKGRNCFSYFTRSLQDAAQLRLRLINDLRKALDKNQFKLYYQPIIDFTTGKSCKVEALIRWMHPKRGVINPVDFIYLTEETGLINEIGDWVFKEATRKLSDWNNQFNNKYQISINLSPVQFKFENKRFLDGWLKHIGDLGLDGSQVILEITEGLLLNPEIQITERLANFRKAGFSIAIDDFGTGYSSLAYLKKFDIDYLKIDRSFVNNMDTDSDDIALSEAIIVMAHKLGLEVIAEGIEKEEQKLILIAAGCNYAQGFYYSVPLPEADIESYLQNENPQMISN